MKNEEKRISFELYKSNVCHDLHNKGDIDFMIDILESEQIEHYFERQWYPECLYLLAMLDYLSRLHQIPLCSDYDDLRQYRLDTVLYPAGILLAASVFHDENIKKEAWETCIPEFRKFNIVEDDIRNVI